MRKGLLFIILGFVVLLISGCVPETPLPTCPTADLEPPELDSPALWEVVDGSAVTLEWNYPDPSCQPEGYRIDLSLNRDFSTLDVTGGTGNPNTSWAPADPLEPATEYFWRIAAINGTTLGPYSTEIRSFFTEPICNPAAQVAPELSLPPDGGIFERGYSSLEWSYPDPSCIPASYRVELSPTSDFSDTALFGGTGNPSTRWGPGSPLDPATQYYWRIAPFTDTTMGPYSETWTFFTDPVCDSAALVAPNSLFPSEGYELGLEAPAYEWDYPDPSCAPVGYHLQVSSTPDFSNIVMDLKHDDSDTLWTPAVALPDCDQYYWRVAAIAENGGGHYVDGPFSDVLSFSVNVGFACPVPTCDPVDIPQPVLYSPGSYSIIADLTPSLEWNNPGMCDPESYLIHLSTENDFSDTSLFGATGTPDAVWSPSSSLEEATQYWWEVAGSVGSTTGPFSSKQSFFTGPECISLSDVVAPERLAPEDGAHLDSLVARLRYTPGDPGCIPDGYSLNLQEDPSFSGTNLLGDYSMPGTTVYTDPLDDCTIYYWKVAAIQDAGYGPFSDVGWFFTNEAGVCVPPYVPGLLGRNLNCRQGGYKESELLRVFEVGEIAEVVAVGPYGYYYALQVPGSDEICWAVSEYIELWGDEDDLEVRIPPQPPSPTPLVCHKDLPKDLCEEAGGEWYEGAAAAPYCKCP